MEGRGLKVGRTWVEVRTPARVLQPNPGPPVVNFVQKYIWGLFGRGEAVNVSQYLETLLA